jgi:hypothetical protein
MADFRLPCANFRRMHCSEARAYSITSSAREQTRGYLYPKHLAVLTLIISSTIRLLDLAPGKMGPGGPGLAHVAEVILH